MQTEDTTIGRYRTADGHQVAHGDTVWTPSCQRVTIDTESRYFPHGELYLSCKGYPKLSHCYKSEASAIEAWIKREERKIRKSHEAISVIEQRLEILRASLVEPFIPGD